MHTDINDFIADLDKRGLLSRVRESVSPDLEIAALTDRVSDRSSGCAWRLVSIRSTGSRVKSTS